MIKMTYISGGVSLSVGLIGCVIGFCCWYNRRKLSLDELALVSSLDAGLPGAHPYQVSIDNLKTKISNLLGFFLNPPHID